MICLTGDVHHSSLNTADVRFCKGSEIDAAHTMARIVGEHNMKVTLFFTGLCGKENPDLIKEIAGMNGIEVGGHNYYAFKPKKLFNIYGRLTGQWNGPGFFQAWEVRRTINILEKITGRSILSWRDHGYRHDRNTRKILCRNGIKYLSDVLSPDFAQPFKNGHIIDVLINTLPDHDYVYHGNRQPGTFDEACLEQTPFRTGAMSKEAWMKKLKEEVLEIEGRGGIAVILAHPACMEVFDNFGTFEKLCRFLSGFESVSMSKIKLNQ